MAPPVGRRARESVGGRPPLAWLRRSHGYPKAFRVRTAADHDAMRRARRVRAPGAAVLVRRNGGRWARCGMAVSRKVGNAVVRNRLKRRLREAFRHLHPELPAVDVVVIARPELADAKVDALRALIHDAVGRVAGDFNRRTG